jgi:hypothetical protein
MVMTNLELRVKALEMVLKNFQIDRLGLNLEIADEIYNYLKSSSQSESIPNDVNHPDCIRLINLHGNTFVLRVGKDDYSIEITKENRFVYNGVESHSVTVR